MSHSDVQYDVFLSHAWEDKEEVARPLATELERLGLRVWFDEAVLVPGVSLSSAVDQGLSVARFGVVVLSPSFFEKKWPKYELSGLKARQLNGEQVILPVWHTVELSDVLSFSPPLADMLAYDTSKQSIESIAEGILQIVNPESHSRWLIQTARHAMQNLDKTQFHGTDFDYWPNGGIRNLYDHLRTFGTYAQLAQHFGRAIWLRGPHNNLELDLHNPADFGHYNPTFVEWLRSNARFVLSKRAFVDLTRPLFDRFLLSLVKLYYITYQYLRTNPKILRSLCESFENGLRDGTLPQQYYYGIAWVTSRNVSEGDEIGAMMVSLSRDCKLDSNVACTSVYFWVRRTLDGTAELFFSLVVDLFTAYSIANYFNLNNAAPWHTFLSGKRRDLTER